MRLFYSSLFAVIGIGGCVFLPYFSFSFHFFFLTLLISFVSIGLFYFVEKKYKYLPLLIFVSFFSLCLASFSLFIFENKKEQNQELLYGQKVSFEASIDEYPTFRESGFLYVLKPEDPEKLFLSPHTRILYKGSSADVYNFGEKVSVHGVLQKPYEKDKKGDDSPFSYGKFLAKDNIFFTVEYGSLTFLSEGEMSFEGYLYQIRDFLKKPIEKNIQGDEGGLTLGVLLGEKKSLSAETEEMFLYVGLSHIVVLSGYNISILAEYFLKIFGFLGMGASSFLTGGFLLLFVIMVGGGATAWRAFLMTAILLFARKTGNLYSALQALLWAGFGMSLMNPYMAAYDPSFHLSFLATLGILLYGPFLKKFVQKFLPSDFFSEILSTTYAASLFVAPYLLFWMHKISFVSLFSNTVILPLVPILMFAGVLFVLLSLLLPAAAPLLSVIVFIPAWMILFLAKLFLVFPGGAVQTSLSFGGMFFSYVCLFLVFIFVQKNTKSS
jgi:competence protein ComEC